LHGINVKHTDNITTTRTLLPQYLTIKLYTPQIINVGKHST